MSSNTTIITVNCAEVIGIPGNNVRHSVLFPDLNNLIALAVNMVPGWKSCGGYDIPVVQELSGIDVDVPRIRQEAKAYLANFFEKSVSIKVGESKVELISKDVEIAFDMMYPVTKKGYGMPKYERVTGNRRSYAHVVANAIRTRLGMDMYMDIPVEAREKMSEMERWMVASRENGAKNEALKMGELDYLYLASKVYDLAGMYEYKFQTEFSVPRGSAQKCWHLVRVSHLLPERDLIANLLAGTIQYSPISKEEVRHLGDALEGKAGKDKVVPPMPTEEQIDKVLGPERVNAPKIAKKTEMEGLFKSSTNDLVVLVLGAILDNDLSRLDYIRPYAHKFNALMSECGVKVSRLAGNKPTIDMDKFKAAEAEEAKRLQERIAAKVAEREAKELAEIAVRRERIASESK